MRGRVPVAVAVSAVLLLSAPEVVSAQSQEALAPAKYRYAARGRRVWLVRDAAGEADRAYLGGLAM